MSGGYSDLLIEHLRTPRNTGVLQNANGVAVVRNPVCGDSATFMLRVDDGRITAARFTAQGCGGSIAALSLTTELLEGLSLDAASQLDRDAIAEAAGGFPSSKIHCAALAADAVRLALADYARRAAPA
ncbi:MAG TPA: iron-sulfur cluster assembly scaffold protein [Dehalococcoidia bacterium]|nr:iron-sulfur cluster assembly scaffold protein [Dehalococcoidia bacterium]